MARFRKLLLRLILLMGIVIAACLVWREALVETAVKQVLSARGLGDARFEVVDVGLNRTVIENVSLGPGLPGVRRLLLSYDPAGLVSGRLGGLRIEGLRVDARDGPDAIPDAMLSRLGGFPAGGGGPPIELPRVQIENAEIMLPAPASGVVAIDGDIDLSGTGLGAALDIAVDLDHTTGAFTIRSGNLGEGGVAEISGGGETDLAGIVLPARAGIAATGGRARYSLEGTAQIPAVNPASPGAWLAGALSLRGDLRLDEVATSAGPAVLSADIGWALTGGGGVLRIDLPRPALLAARGIAPDILAALHLPANSDASNNLAVELSSAGPAVVWSPEGDGGRAGFKGDIAVNLGGARVDLHATTQFGHDASLRLSAPAEVAFRASVSGAAFSGALGSALLRGAEWDAAGTLSPDGELDLAGALAATANNVDLTDIKADAVAIDGTLHLHGTPDRWSLSASPGLTIATGGAALPGRLRTNGQVVLTMDRLEVSGGNSVERLEMSTSSSQLSGVLLSGEGNDVAFADTAGRVAIAFEPGGTGVGEIRLEDARATLPQHAVGLTAVTATLPLGMDAGKVAFSGEVRDTGRAARFRPLGINLEGERDGETVAVTGAVEILGRGIRLPLKGSADLAEMTGQINAGPTRVRFAKGGRQPGALSPQLAALRDVEGTVRVGASAALRSGGTMRTGMSLAFDGLSARMGGIDVAGLSGKVRLNSLSPLATAGEQQLTARRVIAGVPVEDTRIRFTIPPRRRGVSVRIHDAAASLAGGEIALKDARWDSAAKTNAFDVLVSNVAIGRLLSDWRVEGISGTGHLSGRIPASIGPAGLAIAGGRLATAGAGAIRVDWGAARETLANSGEQVALMVRALEDFQYNSLSADINLPEGGALTLGIGLEGANPEVLDGYPFRFNINLSGKLAPILDAVREGRRIGAELLQGGF